MSVNPVSNPVPNALLEALKAVLGSKLHTNPTEMLLYRYDAIAQGPAPVAVMIAESTQDVANTLKLCNAYKIPVVPRGGSSGLSGGVYLTADARDFQCAVLKGCL